MNELQKKQMERMMKYPAPQKRVSMVRLQLIREEYGLYGMERIEGPEQAAEMVKPLLAMADREMMMVLSLDAKLQPLAVEIAAVGGVSICHVDIRNLFKHAVMENAHAVICFHNHPTGIPDPGKEDFLITERIRQAGELLEISLLDHIIIGRNKFYSFQEHGRLGVQESGQEGMTGYVAEQRLLKRERPEVFPAAGEGRMRKDGCLWNGRT